MEKMPTTSAHSSMSFCNLNISMKSAPRSWNKLPPLLLISRAKIQHSYLAPKPPSRTTKLLPKTWRLEKESKSKFWRITSTWLLVCNFHVLLCSHLLLRAQREGVRHRATGAGPKGHSWKARVGFESRLNQCLLTSHGGNWGLERLSYLAPSFSQPGTGFCSWVGLICL